MAPPLTAEKAATKLPSQGSEEEDEEELIEEWDDWQSEDDESSPDILCLFCSSRFRSADAVFYHCSSEHAFDFRRIVKELGLNFYSSFKLINYVRSQVALNKCWCCGLPFQCNEDLLKHLHSTTNFEKDRKLLWENENFLKPFIADDSLLHCFADEDNEDDVPAAMDKDELMKELIDEKTLAELCNGSQSILSHDTSGTQDFDKAEKMEFEQENVTGVMHSLSNGLVLGSSHQKQKDKNGRISFAVNSGRQMKDVNENYFGSYGSFGIHREMISDKVRTDAYREALLNNPSLLKKASVMDVGCGTGILSLFAAQAGASRVVAVEASSKMAAVAAQIVRDNGHLLEEKPISEGKQSSGVINVVNCMIEELDQFIQIAPNSVDVLISEWMGYCLLHESMLSSVLYARDKWLKPGGAILPDTATIFCAGFGKGGTSLPFWENIYGFNMACIGKEIMEDTARAPVVDIIESQDIVTESEVVHYFDLATMKPDEVDFTASFELKLKQDHPATTDSGTCFCYGIVLWFETGFTSRFCKDMPTVLSTSPYSPRTHWSQSIFTFREPIAMTSSKTNCCNSKAPVGPEECSARKIMSCISIARSSTNRRVDVSIEITGVSLDGRKRNWPAQIFNL